MALDDYGVLIGPYVRFYRDPPDNEGRYLHGHVVVQAGAQQIDCAVDCNHSTSNVRYLQLSNLDATRLGPIVGMADGFHHLPTTTDPAAPTGGALDYKRNPLISAPLGCAAIVLALLDRLTGNHSAVWKTNQGDSAVAALQAMVATPVDKVYVFGDRWQNPQQNPPWGMHDVHCNQGDPMATSGTNFQALDGVWQDGGVLVRRPGGRYDCFIVMFTTQTLDTNDTTGLPN